MSNTVWPTIAQALNHARQTAVAPLAWDPVGHLLSRCTFGPTTASRAALTAGGPEKWYADQVTAANTCRGYAGDTAVAAQGPLLALSPYDLRTTLQARGDDYGWDAMDQLTRVTLGLQTWSPAQLYEVLVDFFGNHLNIPNHYGEVWNLRHTHDRDVVRRYATSSFTGMLLASAKNPAMLTYLNLAESTKGAVNENYGREVLELHTVGRIYSEDDVKNCARLLTGRTLDDYGHYLFDDYIHATGKVTVLGFSDDNAVARDGQAAGDNLLRYLAAHPATATNLARKLCLRLVSDSPSPELVAAVAKAYTDSHTQILPMVSTILRSTEFWESRGRKVRRPTENLLATVRALDLTPTSLPDALQSLHWMSRNVGNAPLDWPAPNGYPDVAVAWRSSGSLLQAWSLHLGFAGGWWGGLSIPSTASLYGGNPTTSGAAILMMGRRLTGTTLTAAHRTALQTFLDEPATTAIDRSKLRWMASSVAAIILDGPHHALR